MEKGKIAPEEQFLPLSTIFYYLMLDFYVKTGIRFSLRDKRLFEITEVEITRVDCRVNRQMFTPLTPKTPPNTAAPESKIYHRELNYLRMIHKLEKIKFFNCKISGSISLIIREEHGIHCMPCSSRIINEMTP